MSGQAADNIQSGKQGRSDGSANLLLAVSNAASLLLTAGDREDIDSILVSSLEIIGRAVDVDRVLIWRDELSTEKPALRCLYTWENSHGRASSEVPEIISAPFGNFPEWYNKLRSGECIGDAVSALAPDEQIYFNSFDTKTIYATPLSFGDCFWGLVSVHDCKRERKFTDDEIIILKSVSLMVAYAINHRRMVVELLDVNEKAEAANRAKNAFFSNMSHEVRTPLNAIVGMALVGRNSKDVDEKDHALSKIGDASSHLLEIISNVLDMASIEEDKLELIPLQYVFRDMIDKVTASVKPLAKEKNQSVLVNIDDQIPRCVIGDELRMAQLITNLMTNAVKFTPIYGKVWLDVILINETDENLELRIVVKDNGIGISEERQSKLFMPFEVAQGALNRDYGGTGLGLPISKRLVELMGGQILVESEPNRGTTVFVTMQLAKGHTEDDLPDDEENEYEEDYRASDSLVVPGEFKGKRLLIAEDIEINREIMIALLKGSELIIDCAEDGQVAVDMVMFNVEKYDIIFMYLQMPNLGGLEAARQIRSLPERKRGRLPVIAMTANVMSDDIKACLDAGMDDHLGKPLDIVKVLEVLRKYLSE